jgi:hypothetical protein
MWRITVIANAVMMGLFWLASLLSVAIVNNRFVQYSPADRSMALPLLTDLALSTQLWAGLLPLAWIILSFTIWKKVKDKGPETRSEYLLAFTMTTIVVGMVMLICFALAGMLPFLYIGVAIK